VALTRRGVGMLVLNMKMDLHSSQLHSTATFQQWSVEPQCWMAGFPKPNLVFCICLKGFGSEKKH